MKSISKTVSRAIGLVVLTGLVSFSARAEVLLQYFETPWDEIYQRLPEIAETGYEGIWTPPPTKSPHAGGQFAGGGNVGYSHYDKFDLGEIPQRGSFATRYGTRASLRGMVDNAHQCDIKIYPDIVMNHFGNGPDYRTYPGTQPRDFHGWVDGGQPGGFKRSPRMNAYDDINNGNGYTFQQELVSLIDLQTEPDGRFSSGYSMFSTRPWFNRQPGQPDVYPYGVNTNEDTIAFINRWIAWLGNAMDYDGIRMDAPKHVIADFFGLPGGGFNHEVQVNFDFRRGYTDLGSYADLYKNYVRRKDALIFSEFFIGGIDQVNYWRTFGGQGVKMRYLDFPRKSGVIFPAFNNGDLRALGGTGFSEAEGVVFCQSHDESAPSKLDLAYVYALTHIGLPVVFFTGNNLAGSDVNVKTWMKIGHGSALGDYNNGAIPNLVYINNNFTRGYEVNRVTDDADCFVYERFEDTDGDYNPISNFAPENGESILIVGLNDSGGSKTKTISTGFPNGTQLHDYTGNQPADVTVSGGQVTITIPGSSVYPVGGGQSWVCYAPYNASANGDPLRFSNSSQMNWIVPGGSLATAKSRTVTRLTGDTTDIDVYFNSPSGVGVDYVTVKWGEGRRVNNSASIETNNQSLVHYGFQPAASNSGYWRLSADLTGVPEGLHLVKGRCFNNRPANYAPLFQTFTETVYVDRRGPDLSVTPAQGSTNYGDVVMVISNADRTAAYVEVVIDGGAPAAATEVMKGLYKFNVSGLTAGEHTAQVRAYEKDWGNPRKDINTGIVSRVFTVNTPTQPVSIGFAGVNNGTRPNNIELPYFKTVVTAPGASSVKLYWDGYELPLTGGGPYTNVFDGSIVRGGQTQRLWGAFVNGEHFFEAAAVSGGVTNRAAVKKTFNLYGSNQIDSDGDGLPDNLEMPFFDSGAVPGPNVPWPGDTSGSGNQDMIPNYNENWTRLNPMNADTDYDGTWDDNEDSDSNINSGDGVPNGCEVRQGYLVHDNAYYYNVYNTGSKPATCVETNGGAIIPAQVSWSPANPDRCAGSTLTVTYVPNQGPLSNASPIVIAIGTNAAGAMHANMTGAAGGQWQYAFNIPGAATNITFWFRDSLGKVDSATGTNHVPVGPCVVVTNFFVMDGNFDNSNYEVANAGMKILAAVKSNNLYVATWSANGDAAGSDHFVFVTDTFGLPAAPPWGKAGFVYFDKAVKPYLSAESSASDGFKAFNNSGAAGRSAMGSNGNALEGELDLLQVFGYVPDVLYIAAVAYGDNDAGGIPNPGAQCPALYGNGAYDLEITEFQAVPVASIRDENLDGVFDGGKPQMWTVVNGNTNDANYNIRRFFIDEIAGDEASITVQLVINGPGGTNVISNVELFSNLNRRDFAVLPGDEDPETITTASATTYYRAYPMSGSGQGPYTATLKVNRCGAYRINARYKINGQRHYYTDHGLRRDCAVVVTPKKAMNLNVYELNPLTAEASKDDFFGRSTFRDMYVANTNRPDVISTNYFKQLGVNMLWLQPIHPIGSDNRETDPSTGSDYDPGSPYAVRNYWQVNGVLGDPWTADGSQAQAEFSEFVQAMDANGVGVMLDGTFNHSAWDCEIGQMAVDMFPWATNATDLIRQAHPQWYSKKGDHGKPASYYQSSADTDIATAPDRFDFGKWSDVADFFFGTYDALVQGQTDEWRDRYLLQEDRFDGFATNATRDLWQYFAQYPLYWLEKTGHPAGTPKSQSYKGIDGLRCDFAQGLPSLFWEYTINKTRSVKWDFIFMAESLDGYREVNGNKRNGLSFRSARHFDVLNENLVFYWRDQFFDYKPFGGTPYSGAQPYTYATWKAFDDRRNAYDVSPILLNLTGHDELLPHDDQWRVIYAYGILASQDGAPMLFAGQESGLQNSATVYTNRPDPKPELKNNYGRYEVNFGKGIPHFKRYNMLTNVWKSETWKTPMKDTYQRINRARASSAALRSQNNYMLNGTSGWNPNIFGAAKYEAPGVSASSQDVVFVFVNNNYAGSTNRYDTYDLDVTYNGGPNWFGIEAGKSYNLVDLASPTPAAYVWTNGNKTGSTILSEGLTVILNGNPYDGRQLQYLKLVDVNATYPDSDGDGIPDFSDPDDDNDGLPDWWEGLYGPRNPGSDDDTDGNNNYNEFVARTAPNDPTSSLKITDINVAAGASQVKWPAVPDLNYRVQRSEAVENHLANWQQVFFGTALSSNEAMAEALATNTSRYYRVLVQP